MGESERYQDYHHLRARRRPLAGADNNALMALIAMMGTGFLLLLALQVSFYFSQKTYADFYVAVVRWLELPSDLTTLSERPWTLLTHLFTVTGSQVLSLLGNLLWLWGFGYLWQDLSGNDKLIPVFLYGGLAGALFFIGAHYALPSMAALRGSTVLLGAHSGVLAIAAAVTTLEPGYRIFRHIRNGMPIWVLLTMYLVIDFAAVMSANPAFALSHLGGALAGYLFVVLLRKGYDGSRWMNNAYLSLMRLFRPKESRSEPVRQRMFYNTGEKEPFVKRPSTHQQRIDEILDKINDKGIQYLTDEERDILRRAAEEGE